MRAYLALLLLASAPFVVAAPAGAQTFGMAYATPAVAAGAVDVEITRDGRPFWRGRIELTTANSQVSLFARPEIRGICFAPQPGMQIGVSSEDSLNIRLTPDGRPDRFRFRLDWRVVRPAVAGLRGWDVCRESLEQTEGLAFEARVELAPGVRTHIRGADGFEAILTRAADAPQPETAPPPAERPAAVVNTDFEVRVERAGVLRWQGVLHQETVVDEAKMREEVFRPVLIPCTREGRTAPCPNSASDHWEIRLRDLNSDGRVDIDFEANRSAPLYQFEEPGAGYPRGGGGGSQVSASLRIVLPRGETREIRIDDAVVRVTRR